MNRHTQLPFTPQLLPLSPPLSPALTLGHACHPLPSPSIHTELTSVSVPYPQFRTRARTASPDVFRLGTVLEEETERVVTEG